MQEDTPLSKSLVSTDLALGYDIRSPSDGNGSSGEPHHQQSTPPKPLQLSHQSSQGNSSANLSTDLDDLGSGAAGDKPTRILRQSRINCMSMVPGQPQGPQQNIDFDFKSLPMPLFQHQFSHLPVHSDNLGSEAARDKPALTLNRPGRLRRRPPRFVWNKEHHKRFREAINHLGKDAVPTNIMKFMNVDGLTRGIVSSHLQRFREYLRTNQSSTSGKGAVSEPATTPDLFESSPVVPDLQPNRVPSSDHIMPSFDPAAAAANTSTHLQLPQFHHQKMAPTYFKSWLYPTGIKSDPDLDRLIKSYPWPSHLLLKNGFPNSDNVMPPFVSTTTLLRQQQQVAAAATNPYLQPPQFHHQNYWSQVPDNNMTSFVPVTSLTQQQHKAAATNPYLQPPQFHQSHLNYGSPVPYHFSHPNQVPSLDHIMSSYVPITTLQQQQLMAAAAATNPYLQAPRPQMAAVQYGSPENVQFNSQTTNRQFGSPPLRRQTQQKPLHTHKISPPSSHSSDDDDIEALESGNAKGEGTLLNLFPTTSPQQPSSHSPVGDALESGNANGERTLLNLLPTRDKKL